MNESGYLDQVASLAGLRRYPRQGPWGKKSGSVIGTQDGYIVVVGFARANRQEKLVILLRFKSTSPPETIKAAVLQNPALATKKQGALAEVGKDFLRWEWTYSFAKPKAEEVVNRVKDLREALKPVTSGFGGRCEKCDFASTSDLLLWNGMPAYVCAGCQERVRSEMDQAAANYEALEPNHVNGAALGVVAAALGGVAWGLIAFGLHSIFLYGAILIGYLIAWAMLKGTHKVTLVVQILAPLLTIASVLFGDALYFALEFAKQESTPFTLRILKAVLLNLFQIEKESGNALSVVFGLIGAAVAVYRARKPKFRAVFEPLRLTSA